MVRKPDAKTMLDRFLNAKYIKKLLHIKRSSLASSFRMPGTICVLNAEKCLKSKLPVFGQIRFSDFRILDFHCLCKYSGMPKFKLVRISERQLWFGTNLVGTIKMSEIQTISFNYRTRICVRKLNNYVRTFGFRTFSTMNAEIRMK